MNRLLTRFTIFRGWFLPFTGQQMFPGASRQGMVAIPAGEFRFYTKRDPKTLDPFIPFPDFTDTIVVSYARILYG